MKNEKNKYRLTFLLVTFTLLSVSIFGQNSYKFIEPNISFHYDSLLFKITNRYSNTSYETESYDFKALADTAHKVKINIATNTPVETPPSLIQLESRMQNKLKVFETLNDPKISVVDYDKSVRHIGDFLCVGYIILDKATNITLSMIVANHISESDLTEIKLTSRNRKALKEDYEILEQLLKGFKSYSKAEIFQEDSLINAKYSVVVNIAKDTLPNFKGRTNAYLATVKVNEQLQNKVKEVRLKISIGEEIFSSNENGEVYIACSDEEKGSITRKGDLIIINSFGKNVKLPFSFQYERK
jgi:hypothetical protein